MKNIDNGQTKVSLDSFQKYWWSWILDSDWPEGTPSVGLNGKSGDLNCILPLMITSMQK